MRILVHIIILFIFVYVLLMINIPQIAQNDYIKMKIYIFGGIFIFEFIVALITTIFKKCLINIGKIIKNSLLTALICTIGYSIYNDLAWKSNPLVINQTTNVQNLTISIIIILFIIFGYFIEILLNNHVPGINDCLNTIYPQNKNQ